MEDRALFDHPAMLAAATDIENSSNSSSLGSLPICAPYRRVLNRFFVASESFESVGCRPRSA